MKKEEFCNFIGIDVSKKTLDVAFIFNNDVQKISHRQISNDAKGIKELISMLKKQKGCTLENTLFCFEQTGIYGRELALTLCEKNYQVWIEMPVAILRSIGLQRGKNDKVDSKRIAVYAMKNCEKSVLWEPPRKVVVTLRQLMTTRERIIKCIGCLKKPINEFRQTGNKDMALVIENTSKNALKGLEKDLKKIELEMDKLIKSDDKLSRLFGLITSVSGIGKITTIELICFTNEFKMYNTAKQLACYCGVAPFEYSSGSSVRGKTRVSRMANKSLKTILHLCAMSALQSDSEIKAYYERKVLEGKNKMSVINAVRNKLIHRITAVVKRQTPFVRQLAA